MYIKKILLAIVLVGLLVAGGFAYFVYQAVFSPNTSFESNKKVVFIPTNSTFDDVVKILEPSLNDVSTFVKIATKKGYNTNVKAGKFILTNGMNNNDIVNALRSKNTPVQVTFNNQERLEDLAGRIAVQIEADSTELLNAFVNKDFLNANNFNTESALSMYLPNKYEFFWNTSGSQFRDRMLREYKAFWSEDRLSKANQIGLTPTEVITMASIVQKETAKVDERRRVAGVYMNRYTNGWKLDADPTVIYALKKYRNDWDTVIKRVLYKDLELDSPYNTYRYNTLPPGPITMPDISSIDAVLNYEKHDYYFFVADVQNMGYHKFAKTMVQHNQNKQQYIRWINEQGIKR